MGTIGVWFSTFRKAFIATATFAVGALLKLLPALSITLYIALGAVIFIFVLVEEFITSIKPAVRLREITPAAMDGNCSPRCG